MRNERENALDKKSHTSSNLTRREILMWLSQRSHSAGEIAGYFQITPALCPSINCGCFSPPRVLALIACMTISSVIRPTDWLCTARFFQFLFNISTPLCFICSIITPLSPMYIWTIASVYRKKSNLGFSTVTFFVFLSLTVN